MTSILKISNFLQSSTMKFTTGCYVAPQIRQSLRLKADIDDEEMIVLAV